MPTSRLLPDPEPHGAPAGDSERGLPTPGPGAAFAAMVEELAPGARRESKPRRGASRVTTLVWPEENPLLPLLVERHAVPFPLAPRVPGAGGLPRTARLGFAFSPAVQAYLTLGLCGAVADFRQWARHAARWWRDQLEDPGHDAAHQRLFHDPDTAASYALALLERLAWGAETDPAARSAALVRRIQSRHSLAPIDALRERDGPLLSAAAEWVRDELEDPQAQDLGSTLIPRNWVGALPCGEAAMACLQRLARSLPEQRDKWRAHHFRSAAAAWLPPGATTTQPAWRLLLDATLLLCCRCEPIARSRRTELEEWYCECGSAFARDRSQTSLAEAGATAPDPEAASAVPLLPTTPAAGAEPERLPQPLRDRIGDMLANETEAARLRARYFLRVLFSELFFACPAEVQQNARDALFSPIASLLGCLGRDPGFSADVRELAQSLASLRLFDAQGMALDAAPELPECFQPQRFRSRPSRLNLVMAVGTAPLTRFDRVHEIALLVSDAFRDAALLAQWTALGIAGSPPNLDYLEGKIRVGAREHELPLERREERQLLYRSIKRLASSDMQERITEAIAELRQLLPDEQISAAWAGGSRRADA